MANRGHCDVNNAGSRAYPVLEFMNYYFTEIAPGRGLAQTAQSEIDCSFFYSADSVHDEFWQTDAFAQWGSAANKEGWPLVAGAIGRDIMGASLSVPARIGSFYARARADVRFANDVCLNAANLTGNLSACTLAQAAAVVSTFSFNTDNWDYETERLLAQPAEAMGARGGDLEFRDLRASLVAALNTTYSEADFINLYVRFGQPEVVRDFGRLVDVYRRRATGGTVSATEFGADLLPQLYPAGGVPVVGVGREPTCFVAVMSPVLP
jgi:hypothetical protein